MGGSESKGQAVSGGPPKTMPPEPPYPGAAAEYRFVDTEVVLGTKMSLNFLQSSVLTSNIDSYYPLLAAQYAQGYRLLSYYQIPDQGQQRGFFNTTLALAFQGIFCRYHTSPRRGNWQLSIEKSVIQLQHMHNGIITFGNTSSVVSDTSHILESIVRNAQKGGRLICIEMTGRVESVRMATSMQGFSPMMGVDLFFEIPESTTAQQYIYNCVSVPIMQRVKPGFQPKLIVECDWIGVLASNLNQGWRLIEIFMDQTTHTQAGAFSSRTTMNSIWFFEKPAARLNDPSPVYEGVVLDHLIKIKNGARGTHTITNWEPVIQEMGNKGWELACILETPEVKTTGLMTVKRTCKLFFQRPILPQGGVMMPSQLPPPYDAAVGWLGGGQGEGSSPAPPTGFNVPPAPKSCE